MYTLLFLLAFLPSVEKNAQFQDQILDECTYCAICNSSGREAAGHVLLVMDYDVNTYKLIVDNQKKRLINNIYKWLNKNGTFKVAHWYNKEKFTNEQLANKIVNDIENGDLSYQELKLLDEEYIEIGKLVYGYRYYYIDFQNFLTYVLSNTNFENGICGVCNKQYVLGVDK